LSVRNNNKKLKVVLLDIESSPIHGLAWETYNTSLLRILEPSKIISVAWKELSVDETQCVCLADYKGYKAGVLDDMKLVAAAWDVLDQADVVITHNGDNFDLRKLNARFIAHGFTAPSDYKSIDTLKSSRKYFRFDRNKLDYIGDYLNAGHKMETGGFKLWLDCFAGDKAAWKKLKEYNKQDVLLLENVYLKLRPYIANHPNLSLLSNSNTMGCASCQSHNLQKRGFSFTLAGRKQRYQCNDCGSWTTGAYERIKLEEVE
jgi:DNA polymerase elongation subunit (family B)